MPQDRKALVDALANMTDESFGYVVLACADVVTKYENNHGFTRESTRSFIDLAQAINAYAGGSLIDMEEVKLHNPTLFDGPQK